MQKIVLCLICCVLAVPSLFGQAAPTATRGLVLSAGVAGSSYSLDYGEGRESGFTIYGDADLTAHLGAEILYRNASLVTPHDIGENHLLVGPRIHMTRGRFKPYGKGLLGIGTINFQQGYNATASSESYFIYAIGGGLDIRATRHINIRAIDYEYQFWPGFKPNGLTPTGLSVGAAWVF